MKYFILIIVCTFFCNYLPAQTGEATLFFSNPRAKNVVVPYESANNLIIMPLQINDSDTLRFILDTGVRTALITEIHVSDSLAIYDAKLIDIQGLGEGITMQAYASAANTININGIIGTEQKVNVLLEDVFHLSTKLGTTIHGLIGYDLFKDFIIEIDYYNERLVFNKPEEYRYRDRRNSVTLPLKIIGYKPYVEVEIETVEGVKVPVLLLIDTGSSDALWLFENSAEGLKIPDNYIESYLGRGLNGDIYGKKTRIEKLFLNNFVIEKPTVSFPDSIYFQSLLQTAGRNGSIGAEIFRRFNVILDYPNNKITFQKNSYFGETFNYDMSGLELATPYPGLPVFIISEVRQNSPAAEVGLLPEDQIMFVNNLSAGDLTLAYLTNLLRQKEGKKINLTVLRDGRMIKFEFKLKSFI